MIVTMTIPAKVAVTLTKKEAVIFNMNPGNAGGSCGDMTKEVYDPDRIEADAFSNANMKETQNRLFLTELQSQSIAIASEHGQSPHAPADATKQRGVAVFVQETEPTEPHQNDIWIQI
jgi:hypothetical protein